MLVGELRSYLSGGKFTRVVFVKRSDGEVRVMNCRLGVHKGVRGVGSVYEPEERGLLPVWDAGKRHYRMISSENVLEIKSGPREYRAVGRIAQLDRASAF